MDWPDIFLEGKGRFMSDIVPFGKHKGKPVDALLDDREYVDWLTQQGWFRERYGNIYQVVINNGAEPSETPEHNAMQARFLDEEYVRALIRRLSENAENATIERWLRDARLVGFEKAGADVLIATYGYAVCVEIKPTVGDDYPAILRQIKRLGRTAKYDYGEDTRFNVLLVGSYTGVGATKEQFVQIFKLSDITVIFADELA